MGRHRGRHRRCAVIHNYYIHFPRTLLAFKECDACRAAPFLQGKATMQQVSQVQPLDGSDFVRDKSKVSWITAIFMTLFNIGAIAELFFFSWQNVAFAVGLLWVYG